MNYTKGEWKVEKRLSSQMPYGIFKSQGERVIPIVYIQHKEDAHLIAAAPLGYELAKFTSLVSATWIEEGKLEIGEGDYLRMKQLALEFLAKAERKEEKDVLSV